MRTEFGTMLRTMREKQRITLRAFAGKIGMDASNYARIERGEVPPPNEGAMARIAEGLGISPGLDDEWYTLLYHAKATRGEVPQDLLARDDVAKLLPAFFARLRETSALGSAEEMYEVYRRIASGSAKLR